VKAGQPNNIQSRNKGSSHEASKIYPLPSTRADSDMQMAKAMAKELKIPFVDPLHAHIDPVAVSLLKPNIAFKLQAVPIRIVYDMLLVAMAHPQEARGIKTLELFTGCKIRPAAAPRHSVSAALQEVYGRSKGSDAKDGREPYTAPRVKTSPEKKERALTISVISNKGGVGKTHLSINIAYSLARSGAKVLLIDADLGNADISNKLGILPRHHLLDFLEKDKRMRDLIIHTKYKFGLICSVSGDFKLANLNYAQKMKFIKQFKGISRGYDFAIFDLSAGISRTVLDFALAADRTVIVTTPQDLISGYACAKASFFRFKEIEENLKRKLPGHATHWTFTPMVVINMVSNLTEGIRLYNKIDKGTNININIYEDRFRIEPEYIGAIPYDRKQLCMAEARKRPLLLDFPYSKVSQCIQHMSKRFLNAEESYDPRIVYRYPFRRFVAILSQKI
jgi:flagellar biosynthesis protein FlhG